MSTQGRENDKDRDHKLCLVCSSGGHLFQLNSLQPFWGNKNRVWISFTTQDATAILRNERVHWAHYPTNRNIGNLARNLWLAFKILRAERPTVVVSTGAGVGVPFLVLGRLMGIRTVYIESITRSEELSLTGRLVYRFVDRFLVQWPDLADRYARAEFRGQVL